MKDIIKKLSVKNILIFLVLAIFLYSAFMTINPVNKIAVLEITGVIRNPKKYLKSIDTFIDDESVKAVIVRIDSPGGTVGSSQEIYDSLIELNKSKYNKQNKLITSKHFSKFNLDKNKYIIF